MHCFITPPPPPPLLLLGFVLLCLLLLVAVVEQVVFLFGVFLWGVGWGGPFSVFCVCFVGGFFVAVVILAFDFAFVFA